MTAFVPTAASCTSAARSSVFDSDTITRPFITAMQSFADSADPGEEPSASTTPGPTRVLQTQMTRMHPPAARQPDVAQIPEPTPDRPAAPAAPAGVQSRREPRSVLAAALARLDFDRSAGTKKHASATPEPEPHVLSSPSVPSTITPEVWPPGAGPVPRPLDEQAAMPAEANVRGTEHVTDRNQRALASLGPPPGHRRRSRTRFETINTCAYEILLRYAESWSWGALAKILVSDDGTAVSKTTLRKLCMASPLTDTQRNSLDKVLALNGRKLST